MFHMRNVVVSIFAAALFFAIPSLYVYGLRTKELETSGKSVTGTGCSTSDDVKHQKTHLGYNCVLSVAFVTVSFTLATLYGCVLRETKRHNR